MTIGEHTHKAKRKTFRRWKEAGWKTRREAYAAFREIIRGVVDAGYVGRPLPEQYDEFLLWLLAGHPQETEKLGAGLRYFTVCVSNRRRKGYGRYGFAVVDNEGVERTFSVNTALNGMNNTKRSDLMNAFREEVRDQILVVRQAALGKCCPETGELLTESNCEIDHNGVAFEALVRNFVNNNCLYFEQISSVHNPLALGAHRHTLLDRQLASMWAEFHRHFARLEAVSVEGHRRRTYARRNNVLGSIVS